MNTFNLYLQLGIEHIADLIGYDHILFILVLAAVYSLREWKQIIMLITAFTLGHSVTLVLATFNYLIIPSLLIEFLIPLTIFLTALGNIFQKKERVEKRLHLYKYITALFFGLIHGLGFSNYLRSLLGSEESLVKPLFGFNLGIEIGQLIIVSVIILLTYLVVDIFKAKRREWNLILSGMGLGVSIILMMERLPF